MLARRFMVPVVADVTAEELPLSPLRAIEEQAVAAPADECRAECALGRRHGARRPEEDDVKLHGARF